MIFTKRIAIFISAFILSMCLYGVVSSYAASIENINNLKSNYQTVFWINEGPNGRINLCSYNGNVSFSVENGRGYVYLNRLSFRNYSWYGSFNPNWSSFDPATTYTYSNTYNFSSDVQIVVLQGSVNLNGFEVSYFGTLDNWNNPVTPSPVPTSWWYDMWHDLGEQMGTPEFWFGEWFVGLIDGIFGNNDDTTITDNVTIGIPSLAPTPTSIPYQTVVVPQIDPVTGDTYYTYEYHYNNPSGTPIVATAPPPQPTASAGGGNGGGDYAPINGDPYAMPDLPWLNTTVTIGDDNVDIFDGFGSGLDSIDSVGSEYTEGMNVATNAFGFLPSRWLILIGIGAAIILIAGIISRFLS